ncbi:MAG: formylglycine-generating enzyme family protein [Candidatus Latescibacteria bacterium]|jgi:formylglycine-generating enzyme required for sulfatase activity|nr:formylglycine-generating enzyme family protein [Candidatus Latescibacterota bacterium]
MLRAKNTCLLLSVFIAVFISATVSYAEIKIFEKREIAKKLKYATGIEFAVIPAGSFRMGSNNGDNDEKPVHTVTLDAFLMSVTEITQAQYGAVMGENSSHFSGDNRPVDNVTWHNAIDFCRKLSQSTGYIFRLPREAEWEYACRAGTTTNYYTGDSKDAMSRAGWWDGNSNEMTHAVGQKEPNAWGLYDMHGNVWEWCNDWFDSDYYSSSPDINPTGPDSGSRRVLRGGCWHHYFIHCRSAYRSLSNPDDSYRVGFRVVFGGYSPQIQSDFK